MRFLADEGCDFSVVRTLWRAGFEVLCISESSPRADDSSNILAFDKNGKLIFRKDGKLTAEEIQRLIKAIRDHL